MITDSGMRTLGQEIARGIRDAASDRRTPSAERALYAPLLVTGNRVKVLLRGPGEGSVVGELTALEDAGMVIAYADAEVLERIGESVLRVIPYRSVLAVVELLPDADAGTSDE